MSHVTLSHPFVTFSNSFLPTNALGTSGAGRPSRRATHRSRHPCLVWLSQISAFCYSGSHPWLRLTVRCEKRRQQFYWYAYSRIDGKLHNIYLGKQDRLTQARLEHACLLIDQRARKEILLRKRSESTAT